MFGFSPPLYLPYLPGESKVPSVSKNLTERAEMTRLLKFHLRRAQDRMVASANKKRSDRQFNIDDWVLLKLHPYRQTSVASRANQKLAPKFFGPFRVESKIGNAAYRLQLPATSKIHPVFHVSQLKKFFGDTSKTVPLPDEIDELPVKSPAEILERRLINRGGKAAVEVLIRWSNSPREEATWEHLDELQRRFPGFTP